MSLGALQVIKQQKAVCTAAVVFLHGSGQTGRAISKWMKFLAGDFSLPHIKFYFPTAPRSPYHLLDGKMSNVWFNRLGVSLEVPEHKESIDSIGDTMKTLISDITKKDNIALNRVVIGGFSMGGVTSLHTAYRYVPGFAGVFTLSSFLNNNSALFTEAKSLEAPLFMCHGEKDTLVPFSWGQKTYDRLTALGIKAEFHSIKDIDHELEKNEILQLLEWIQKRLPDN